VIAAVGRRASIEGAACNVEATARRPDAQRAGRTDARRSEPLRTARRGTAAMVVGLSRDERWETAEVRSQPRARRCLSGVRFVSCDSYSGVAKKKILSSIHTPYEIESYPVGRVAVEGWMAQLKMAIGSDMELQLTIRKLAYLVITVLSSGYLTLPYLSYPFLCLALHGDPVQRTTPHYFSARVPCICSVAKGQRHVSSASLLSSSSTISS
jgi:hypothetical protein